MTESPTLTVAERNRDMVDRYADGETLTAIADSFGLTRERVRQIVTTTGGANAEASRVQRQAVKDAAETQQIISFLKEHQDTALQMARNGVSRPEVVTILGILHPSMDLVLADEALRESGIIFDQVETTNHFSN